MAACSGRLLLGFTVGAAYFALAQCAALQDDWPMGSRHLARGRAICQAWSEMYALANDSLPPGFTLPRGPLGQSEGRKVLPPAPHLQDCLHLTRQREEWEQRAPGGKLPAWAQPTDQSCGPEPPWVRGGDRDNLAMTRVVQTDLWAHQFPPDCRGPAVKFLVAEWMPAVRHGVGSQLHTMTVALGLAVKYGRVLVPLPGSFQRAQHEGCQGPLNGSLECYFAPLTSPACTDQAITLLAKQQPPVQHQLARSQWPMWRVVEAQLRSAAQVVFLGEWHKKFHRQVDMARRWGAPWTQRPITYEHLGRVPEGEPERVQMTSWWRAQAIRFLLRSPSAYLCHLTNQARHRAYGLSLALHVAASEHSQLRFAQRSGQLSKWEFNTLRKVELESAPLEKGVWGEDEASIPRPIVSIHVRQGDKGQEMKLFSFAAHMWMAERARRKAPLLKYVWLSTEMESVIEESREYQGWKFLSTQNMRQNATTHFHDYEQEAGVKNIVEISLVNLLISAECDFFIGTLGSNWNRLINELRLTNGRLRAGYLSLNMGEW